VRGDNRNGWQGYCTHTSILFAPWHRPYVALFEQTLYGIIQNIASQFPDDSRARYQQAAATFRIPYWDWAITPQNGDYFPTALSDPTPVSVITPASNGATVTIPNPLFSTTFHPLNPVAGDFAPLQGVPYNRWPSTLRYPTSTTSVSAKSQEDQVLSAMATQQAGLQQNVNLLMNDPNYQDFSAFSNHEWQENEPGTFASLEDIHNSIHVAVGGDGGHMSELDYAAFDPAFWLHHTNVDRLFAIWQALNPTSYTIDKPTTDGTFVIQANSVETATTPLAPFTDASGQTWNSLQVQQTETFNYAYPETQKWAFQSTADYQNSILNTIQTLYGSVSNQFTDTSSDGAENFIATSVPVPAVQAKAENVPLVTAQKPITQESVASGPAATPHEQHLKSHPIRGFLHKMEAKLTGEHPTDQTDRGLDLEAEIGKPSATPVVTKPATYTEYIVNVKAPKHILGQAYKVNIFLGEFDSDTTTWHTQDALVGTIAVFGKDTTAGSDNETGCGKCKTDATKQVVVTGTVPLTAQIISEFRKGNCPSLDKANVIPWLTKNLHWRISLADGTERPATDVPGLVVALVTTDVNVPVGGRPQYSGVYESHPQVTAGRAGGS
jgi:tyrosinase